MRDKTAKRSKRRDLLIAAAALGTAGTVPPILRRLRRPERLPHPTLPGFWRLEGGTGSNAALLGIDAPDPTLAQAMAAIQADPEAAFPAQDADGRVIVRSYSDYLCPPCRRLDRWLDRAVARAGAVLHHRVVGTLGPLSERMAHADHAGASFPQYAALRAALWASGSLRPGDQGLRTLAESAGLPVDAYRAAHRQAGCALTSARAEARVLGTRATPSLLVGRTLIIGAPEPALLRKVIAQSLAEGQAPPRA